MKVAGILLESEICLYKSMAAMPATGRGKGVRNQAE